MLGHPVATASVVLFDVALQVQFLAVPEFLSARLLWRLCRKVVTESLLRHADVHMGLNRVNLRILSRSGKRGNRNPFGISQPHDLGTFYLLDPHLICV